MSKQLFLYKHKEDSEWERVHRASKAITSCRRKYLSEENFLEELGNDWNKALEELEEAKSVRKKEKIEPKPTIWQG